MAKSNNRDITIIDRRAPDVRRETIHIAVVTILVSFALAATVDSTAQAEFEYEPPGELESGDTGYTADTVYLSDMRFPFESAPAYPNSQLWNQGGMYGGGGSQCHSSNYSYPWYDNFCEPREWEVPPCPGGTGHQGQDIRPATCEDSTHRIVASESGQITSVGTYAVYLDNTPSGTRHRYLHMDMNALYVAQGDWVDEGDPLGYASDDFGGTPTTIHLHYDIHQGGHYVSPYMALVESYKDLPGVDAGEPDYGVDLSLQTTGLDDFYSEGSSRDVPDALPDDTFQAEILVTNESNEVLRDVELGYLVEHPFVESTDYAIDSDHPEHDRSSWKTNSADPTESDDNPDTLGDTGHLQMHSFSPGETKRVAIDLKAAEYSIGAVDHVEVRSWLTHATGDNDDAVFTGHDGGWDDEASQSEIDTRYAARDQFDVVSPDQWLFDSQRHEKDLEGWDVCYPGHHEQLIHNTDAAALALAVDGHRGCIAAPEWTSVDTDTYDEVVLEMRSHNGPHDAALYWAGDSDLPSLEEPCDEVDRISGDNRYASSAAVSEDAFEGGADEVVVVTGERETTDGVVGAALAARRDAPLLLTRRDEIPAAIEQELLRLAPDRATLVGAEAAIEPVIEDELESLGLDVDRHGGQQRFDTARIVALEAGAPTNTAIIVTGDEDRLIDGIYAAGLAAHLDAPVLLAGQDLVPPATQQAIEELDIHETIVVGGPSVVSESVEDSFPAPLRLGGSNRHQTGLAVALFALETGLETDHAYLTRDDSVIDAYTASSTGDVLLTSPSTGLTTGVRTALTELTSAATLVGGATALDEQVERDACDAYRRQGVVDTNRAVGFEAAGDGDFHYFVLPLGDYDEWSGTANFLRLMPRYGSRPDEGESPWYDVGELFFQDSEFHETSTERRDYIDGPRLDTELLEDPLDPTGDESDDGERSSDPDTKLLVVDETRGVETRRSCSSTDATPVGLVLFVVSMTWLRVVSRRRSPLLRRGPSDE